LFPRRGGQTFQEGEKVKDEEDATQGGEMKVGDPGKKTGGKTEGKKEKAFGGRPLIETK